MGKANINHATEPAPADPAADAPPAAAPARTSFYDKKTAKFRRSPARSREAVRPKSADLVRQEYLRNLRILGSAALFMAVVFGVAFTLARHNWRGPQTTPRPAAAPAAKPTPDLAVEEPLADAELTTLMVRQAETVYEFSGETLRDALVWFELGNNMRDEAAYGEAAAYYRQALDAWPGFSACWAQLGRTYLRLEDFRRARAALERALIGNPNDPAILNDLGVAALHLKNYATAMEFLQLAIDLAPQQADSYFNIALCYLAQKQPEEAARALQQYLDVRPHDRGALQQQAVIHASMGKYEEALKTLESALEVSPAWLPLYADAAATCALMNQPDKALGFLQQATQLSSARAVAELYQQPAFDKLRQTEAGRAFAASLQQRPTPAAD